MAHQDLEKLFSLALENETDEKVREGILAVKNGSDTVSLPDDLTRAEKEGEEKPLTEEREKSLYSAIKELPVPEKIKLAIFGNRFARQLLIRDSNRQVALFVLENPRLTDGEIIEFSNNTNLDDLIFRVITNNSNWTKYYAVKLAFVSNPKVPIDVSIRWVNYLQDRDLRRLAKSKNIPEVIAGQCRKLLDKRRTKE